MARVSTASLGNRRASSEDQFERTMVNNGMVSVAVSLSLWLLRIAESIQTFGTDEWLSHGAVAGIAIPISLHYPPLGTTVGRTVE